jgi:hypothetical protein
MPSVCGGELGGKVGEASKVWQATHHFGHLGPDCSMVVSFQVPAPAVGGIVSPWTCE